MVHRRRLSRKNNAFTGIASWANVAFNLPLQAFTYDSDNKALRNEDFRGSFKLVATPSVLTTGGELTLRSLRVDAITKAVSVTALGANGFGIKYNFTLWIYDLVVGDLTYPGGNI